MSKRGKRVSAHSVTRILFVTTQIAALGWVSVSYLIAVYSTVRLGQPFPVVGVIGTGHRNHTGGKCSQGGREHL